MHFSLWKPLSSLISDKKSRSERDGSDNHSTTDEIKPNPSTLRKLQEEHKLREALKEASDHGSLVQSQDILMEYEENEEDEEEEEEGFRQARSLVRLNAQKEFLKATCLAADRTFESCSSIPRLNEAFSKFLTTYPKYQSSDQIDQLRLHEYSHLSDSKVCLDYCGFGLFSLTQTVHDLESSTFRLSEITAKLSNHVLYGGADDGTMEDDIKTRIMDYLNIPESEYGLLFTVSRGSAFKLLAESYPFRTNNKLLTMFDHESQSVNWMAQRAREKGAKVDSAWFKWPTLKLCSTDLRKRITEERKKRKKDSGATGLFVFPVQSRVTGAKYSYQWMALAQQNNWHVLLDAGSLGPKDMDSLGLSLFRPDFIITSFYRVFGYDPTGFGCLLVKKSVLACLQSGLGHAGPGLVTITPVFPMYLSDSVDDFLGFDEDEEITDNGGVSSRNRTGSRLPAFSGALTSAQIRQVLESRMEDLDNNGASTILAESETILIGEMMKSPVFSDDELLDNSLWIDLGSSPFGPDTAGFSKVVSSSLPPAWFSSPERKIVNNNSNTQHGSWFNTTVRPVPHEMEHFEEIPEEEQFANRNNNHRRSQEIEEEPKFTFTDLTPEINLDKESAITRETEGEFRLGRRERSKIDGPLLFGIEESEPSGSKGRKDFFSMEDNWWGQNSDFHDSGELSDSCLRDYDGDMSNGEYVEQGWGRVEPEIKCHHLDHINMLGLNKTTARLRFLINWLVTSLLQLRLPNSVRGESEPLVHIYGPKIKYERGAAVAFNVRDRRRGLISPEVVQKLAEMNGISLGVGILSHIRILDGHKGRGGSSSIDDTALCKPMESGGKSGFVRVEVVTASLGFLTNFNDVYKLWAFVAKFLGPSFVEEGVLTPVAEGVEE